MKTLSQIANQPTTGTGELKSGLWTTNLAHSLNNGTLNVAITNDELVINDSPVPIVPVIGMALEAVYSGSKARYTLEEFVALAKSECLIPLQQRWGNAQSGTTNNVLPSSKSILTADQYFSNCIASIADAEHAAVLEELVSRVFEITDKTTKKELENICISFATVFVSHSQLEQYKHMQEQEVTIKAELNKLTELNFIDIVRLEDGKLKAVVSTSSSQSALAGLPGVGYILLNATFDAATSNISVLLEKGEKPASVD